MSSSDLYSYETKLEDWVEMLMKYMLRHSADIHTTMWDFFKQDYPPVAADMERWLKERRGDEQQ